MDEKLLNYVWQQKIFPIYQLYTVKGESVEVVDIGLPNGDSGADRFNAKIRIGSTLWAGDVEFHVKSSDWFIHKHDKNAAYNSVILHVVAEYDADVFRADGEEIPQLVLPIPPQIIERYESLRLSEKWIACQDEIADISAIVKQSWMSALTVERLERKREDIERLLAKNGNNWEETFYVFVARNFGFGINAEPFMRLAESLPLNCLAKHKNQLQQIEALFFGQSGLFAFSDSTEEYMQYLQREYSFLRQKFGLSPIDSHQWKMLRVRPMNFPHVRIAQFSSLIYRSSKLFSKILEQPDLNSLRKLFQVEVSPYWLTHYSFGKISKKTEKSFSLSTIDSLLINTVIPFLFAYAHLHNDDDLCRRAFELYTLIPAERNNVVSSFEKLNFQVLSAADTQALLQLKTCYCDCKKCLRCRFGYILLCCD